MKIVIPSSFSRTMSSNTLSTITGARPIDGSSMMMTRGRAMRARPMASICCSPPDRVPASCRTRSARRGKSSKTRARSASRPAGSRRVKAPISRFSPTDISGNTRRASGTMASPASTRRAGLQRSTRRPSSSIAPRATGKVPMMVFIVVLLPDAFPPSRHTISPRRTSSSTSKSAWTGP